MTSFDQFIEPIEICGEAMEGYEAYKMDNMPGMKGFVGLGDCNCADYFRPHGDIIAIIEETRLLESMKSSVKDYRSLDTKDKFKFANTRMREENRLKAYGSMLVLCRLTEKCRAAKNLFKNKKYQFWLVASSKSTEDKVFFDNLRDNFYSMLKGVLGKEIVDDVKVLSPDDLRDKLSKYSLPSLNLAPNS